MASTLLLQHRWKNLLAWLDGHGCNTQTLPVDCREISFAGNGLFARRAFKPGSLLLLVPPEVLMNKMTLKRLYPSNIQVVKALTAVQLISMHLFIWRPQESEDSADPFFGPYISTLPRDFGAHPLTWLVLSRLNEADDLHASLLSCLPPSVLAALHNLYTRFWDDWGKVRTFLQRVPSVAGVAEGLACSVESKDAAMDFLCAWLNVNTRCIYYRLKHSTTDPDNVTMCPIVDFANHTSGQAHMTVVASSSEIWNAAPINPIGEGLQFVSHDDMEIEENQEIFLTYGLHSNKTLLVEYGFVNAFENGPSPSGEIDVQDMVEGHVFTDVQLREVVKTALVAEGYWGDWTLHSTRDGAQPSWRLIAALRLYHLVVAVGAADEDTIQSWRDVTTGKRPRISRGNEESWRKTVVYLCDMLVKRAEEHIAIGCAQNREKELDWVQWMSENIRSLWKEELFVARGVRDGILSGDEY